MLSVSKAARFLLRKAHIYRSKLIWRVLFLLFLLQVSSCSPALLLAGLDKVNGQLVADVALSRDVARTTALCMLYAAAIIFFCFFYTALVFNPRETADNLKKSGAFIPGIRPGEQTSRYIDKVMTRLTLAGALYITFVCLVPEFMMIAWNVHSILAVHHYLLS